MPIETFNCFSCNLYCLFQDQIDWFLYESSKIGAIERPFTPDGASDIGDIWKRQGVNQVAPSGKKLAKPNAMMFFHIPLCVIYQLSTSVAHDEIDKKAIQKLMSI